MILDGSGYCLRLFVKKCPPSGLDGRVDVDRNRSRSVCPLWKEVSGPPPVSECVCELTGLYGVTEASNDEPISPIDSLYKSST